MRALLNPKCEFPEIARNVWIHWFVSLIQYNPIDCGLFTIDLIGKFMQIGFF